MPTSLEAAAALKAALLDDAAVAAILGQRVYPDQAASNAAEPYLVFAEREAWAPKLLSGKKLDLRRSMFEVAAACQSRQQAKVLGAALEALLDGKVHRTFGLISVNASTIEDAVMDEDETPLIGMEFGDRTVRFMLTWWY